MRAGILIQHCTGESAARLNSSEGEGTQGTHQNPVPHGAPVDAIALGPDGDGHSPSDEDVQGLYEMKDILCPAQVSSRWAREAYVGHFDHGGGRDCKGVAALGFVESLGGRVQSER